METGFALFSANEPRLLIYCMYERVGQGFLRNFAYNRRNHLCHPCRISSSFFDFSGKIKKVNWLVVELDGEMEKWVTSKFKTERGLQK